MNVELGLVAKVKMSGSDEGVSVGAKEKRRSEPSIRKVPAVTRAIAILRLLGRTDEPLGVNRIARALGLVPSTALHILRVLMSEGFVKFDENTKLYELDLGVLSIAHSLLERNVFAPLLQSSLARLADEFGMTMYGVKTSGLEHMAVVASASANLPIRLHAEIGTRFPSMVSASGRCVAAFGDYTKSDLKQRFQKVKWDNNMSFDQWWSKVLETKEEGFSIDDGNFMLGVTVVAVPVIEEGRLTYTLVAVGLREQVASIGLKRVVRDMRQLAQQLAEVASK